MGISMRDFDFILDAPFQASGFFVVSLEHGIPWGFILYFVYV